MTQIHITTRDLRHPGHLNNAVMALHPPPCNTKISNNYEWLDLDSLI